MFKTILIFLAITLTSFVLSTEHETCTRFPDNYTIPVFKEDINGRKCKGIAHVTICGGICKTSEKGTHAFPNKESEDSACIPTQTTTKKIELNDCEEGTLPEARILNFNEPSECGCKQIHSVSP
ncbi:hypothetical protein FO519_007792 [Halicephalobus sp. NKZ332]|nr:hypothetical protein FO519_007792 [Halicephalobus sp. NKZ332]